MKDQLEELKQGVEFRQKLLRIEQEKLKSGKISHKHLLSQEEEFVNFQRKFLSGIVSFKTAAAVLEISSSDILNKYSIDPKKYSPYVTPSAENERTFPWETK
jgi:hypothetical protein